jgi:hypothetical protein
MKFFYNALIVVGLMGGSVCAMDQEPALISELVCRSGYFDLDFDCLCSMALVCKQWSPFTVQYVRCLLAAREKVLENDYNKRLQENQFDRGALLTLRKDRLAYGFVGVKVLSEENCFHDEHCELSLWCVTMPYAPDNVISSSYTSYEIIKTWGDPELADKKKYPWIENFRNPDQKALRYTSAGNHGLEDILIGKPFFTCDNTLRVVTFEVTKTFEKAIGTRYEYGIGCSMYKQEIEERQ